jgi:NitT/TauT family transport system substrate-binding protein
MLAGVLTVIGATSAVADPVAIRVAWVTIGNMPPLLEAKKDLARHWGVTYTAEAIHFQGTPPIITALAAGELELANLSYAALGNAFLNAGMSDLRIIGDDGQDGVPGHASIPFMVLKDGPIKTVEDLKGKVLGTNSIGSAVDIAARTMLKRHGLLEGRDYSVIEANFPNLPAMLLQGKTDLIVAVSPFYLEPRMVDNARTLFTQHDAMGDVELAVWTMRQGFIATNRAAVVDFFEDYLRILRWYQDPANRPEMLKIMSGIFKIPADALDRTSFNDNDIYLDPDGRPNMTALQHSLDVMVDLGFLKSPVIAARYTDLSMMQEADKRVGPAKR